MKIIKIYIKLQNLNEGIQPLPNHLIPLDPPLLLIRPHALDDIGSSNKHIDRIAIKIFYDTLCAFCFLLYTLSKCFTHARTTLMQIQTYMYSQFFKLRSCQYMSLILILCKVFNIIVNILKRNQDFFKRKYEIVFLYIQKP